MFFILSKILFFLLIPFWWIVLLYIWMRVTKSPKVKKRLKVIIIVIAVVFTNPFIYRTMVGLWQPLAIELPHNKTYEAGIVLGGFSGYDKYERGYFGNNADRFIQTANLYHQGIIKKIIMTSGTGSLQQNEPPEALFVRKALIANNVKDSDIILESRSRNTFENAIYSKKIIDSLQIPPPYVLITSALHMKRSGNVFRKAGYDFIEFPCDYKVTPANFTIAQDMLPNISLLNEWSYFIKEIVGLCVYKLTGKA